MERRKPKEGEKDCFYCKHFIEDCHNHGSLISGWCNIDNDYTSDWSICDLFEEQEDKKEIC